MATFSDQEGKEWSVRVRVKSAQECRDAHAINLFGEDAFERLQSDPIMLHNVLWVLCRDEAKGDAIRRDDFEERVAGDTAEAAFLAVMEAIANFCGGLRKKALLAGLKKYREMTAEMTDEKVEQMVASQNPTPTPTESGD